MSATTTPAAEFRASVTDRFFRQAGRTDGIAIAEANALDALATGDPAGGVAWAAISDAFAALAGNPPDGPVVEGIASVLDAIEGGDAAGCAVHAGILRARTTTWSRKHRD